MDTDANIPMDVDDEVQHTAELLGALHLELEYMEVDDFLDELIDLGVRMEVDEAEPRAVSEAEGA